MGIIDELENTISELEQDNAENSKALAGEYKNAVAILKDEKLITSCTLEHVINDLQVTIEFDVSKDKEYSEAIAKLQNASI